MLDTRAEVATDTGSGVTAGTGSATTAARGSVDTADTGMGSVRSADAGSRAARRVRGIAPVYGEESEFFLRAEREFAPSSLALTDSDGGSTRGGGAVYPSSVTAMY